jgi:uncharacterized membrane protein
VGAATGLRSTVGLAALIDAGTAGLPALLTRPRARAAARLGVASELVLDKLPSTPSRLEPAGLAGRIVLAAMTGVVLARGANERVLEPVVIASAAAIAGAKLGHDARAAAAEIFPPFAVAIAEDGLAVGLAAASSRVANATPDRVHRDTKTHLSLRGPSCCLSVGNNAALVGGLGETSL